MKHLRYFEGENNEIVDGEYFIYHATTSSNEYFLSKMKIDINNIVLIETLYKTEDGEVVLDKRKEKYIRWNDTIDNFLKNTYHKNSIKFHSFDLEECKNKLEILAQAKKYNL